MIVEKEVQKIIQRRVLILLFGLCIVFPLIIFRLFYIQVIQHTDYSKTARDQYNKSRGTPPRRASIRDRYGELLAQTKVKYDILIHPKKLRNKEDQTVITESMVALSKLINKPIAEIHQACVERNAKVQKFINKKIARDVANGTREKKARRKHERNFLNQKYVVFKDVPQKIAIQLQSSSKTWVFDKEKNKTEIKNKYWGFSIDSRIDRHYPKNTLAAHILGYVGAISAEELKKSREQNKKNKKIEVYKMTDIVGKGGIEQIYEEKLRGKRGAAMQVKGEDVPLFQIPPEDGSDVYLTIDSQAQQVAEDSLDKMIEKTDKAEGGAVAVIEIRTGEIIVMATSPRYDNNTRAKYYRNLREDKRRPLENRAIYNNYPAPPGSIIKVISGIAVLEEGIAEHSVYCRRYLHRPGSFRCTHFHGTIGLVNSVTQSCNIYFYRAGQNLGESRLTKWIKMFGFGEKTNISLKREYTGFVPTAEWKAKRGMVWYPADSRYMGIGQLITATPLQVARAMAMVASEGALPRLQIVKGFRLPYQTRKKQIEEENNKRKKQGNKQPQKQLVSDIVKLEPHIPPYPPIIRQIPISRRTIELIKEGMVGVVHNRLGTARNIEKKLQGLIIASKTGTSQVDAKYEDGKRKQDHAWFAGFAPANDPIYAFAVFIEHGGYGGSAAAPIAADVLMELFK